MLGDDEFRLLLSHLDRSWAGYRKVRKGVKKRLRRHMEAVGCSTIECYLEAIDGDAAILKECQARLAVTISRFFRDRRLWEQLQQRYLPQLAERFAHGLKAWSAGCANGEEPYSLAMVAEALEAPPGSMPTMQILATDANRICLQRAKVGLYPASSLKEVPEETKLRWFQKTPGKKQWQVDQRIKHRIHWRHHQLLGPPPGDTFHVILLRNNLLTYYRGPYQDTAFKGILSVLVEGGLLIVGSHERLPTSIRCLRRSQDCPWVYTRLAGATQVP